MKLSRADKLMHAEGRAAHWLAEGNAAAERGNHAKAERLYEKSQFWHDRYNKLAGNA